MGFNCEIDNATYFLILLNDMIGRHISFVYHLCHISLIFLQKDAGSEETRLSRGTRDALGRVQHIHR